MNSNTIINSCVKSVEQLICIIANIESNNKIRIELINKFQIKINNLFNTIYNNILDRRDNNNE